jgi:hypothetical protein
MEKLRKQRPVPQPQAPSYKQQSAPPQSSRPYSAKTRNAGTAQQDAPKASYAHAHNFRGYKAGARPSVGKGAEKQPQPSSMPDQAGPSYARPTHHAKRERAGGMPEPRAEPWQKSDAAAGNEAGTENAERLRNL